MFSFEFSIQDCDIIKDLNILKNDFHMKSFLNLLNFQTKNGVRKYQNEINFPAEK